MPLITDPSRLQDETNFPGLGEYLSEQGIVVEHRFQQGQAPQWLARDAAATQAVIDGFNPLPYAKKYKAAAIKAEGLARIRAVFPAITDFDELQLVTNIMQSILPAAKSLTAGMTTAAQIYTAAQNALTAVQNATTVAQVRAVTPAWP